MVLPVRPRAMIVMTVMIVTIRRTAGRRAIWTAVSVAVSRPRSSDRRPMRVAAGVSRWARTIPTASAANCS